MIFNLKTSGEIVDIQTLDGYIRHIELRKAPPIEHFIREYYYINIYFSDLQEMPATNHVLIKKFISLNSQCNLEI